MQGSKSTRIFVFYPKGQISRLQELQMTTVHDGSVVVNSFEGGGDDMDGPIKAVTMDPILSVKHGLCSINSVNWGRVCIQQVHYFWSYLRTVGDGFGPSQIGREVDFAIPTGAMGNVCAGMYTKRMGLPIRTLIIGTNANDIAHRTVSKGEFHKKEMHQTLSEAINIQVPYNFERFFHFLSGQEPKTVRAWMSTMEKTEKLTLEDEVHAALADGMASNSVHDEVSPQPVVILNLVLITKCSVYAALSSQRMP